MEGARGWVGGLKIRFPALQNLPHGIAPEVIDVLIKIPVDLLE